MSRTEQPSKTDLMYEIVYNPNFVPVKSPNASVKEVTEGGRTTNLLKNHHTGQYYELDEASNVIWGLIDGERTVEKIYREAQASGKIEEPEAVNNSLLFFAEHGILRSATDPIIRKRVRVESSFMTSVTLIWDSTKIFRSIHRIARPILRGSLFWVSMAIVIVGTVVFAPRFGSIFNDARNFQILGSTVVGFLFYNFIVLAPVITIHEMCHGLALMHYSGKTGEVGTGLFYFGPMFYVDATGYWSLSRRQRIMIMWAGNLSTLLIGAGIVITRFFVPYPVSAIQILDMTAFWCFYSTLWNLAPPFETDGYHILADIVNVPTLRADAFAYLKAKLLRILRRPAPALEEVPKGREKVLLGYSIFAVALLGYIVFQSVRFTSYMAGDALSWAGTIWAGTASGGVSTLAYAVGLTSIAYFVLTLSGYGVLIRNQVKKTLARGLRFEAVHDRDVSVFFYVPSHLGESTTRRLESKISDIARKIASNHKIDRAGRLVYANLQMGGTSLPLSQVKLHFRKIERGFFQAYYEMIVEKTKGLIQSLVAVPGSNGLHNLMRDMAEKAQPGERDLVKEALAEFLRRERENAGYFLASSFATVWTVELPPAQEYELLQTVIPSLFLEDLTMTCLPGEIEEFKRRTVYGLDSIASLASESSESRNNAVNSPEKSQLVAFFEPVRGRLIFIGRTERIEGNINTLGPLFTIQAWAGYLDNLLGDASLNLNSIVQSLSEVSPDLATLRDGEVWTLHRAVSSLGALENGVHTALIAARDTVKPCKEKLKDLKKLFEPDRKSRIPLLSSVLALNLENIDSVQLGAREVMNLTRSAFTWLKNWNSVLDSEWKKREAANQSRNKELARIYYILVPFSAVLLLAGVVQPAALLALVLIGLAVSLQAGFGTAYYLFRRKEKSVGRYPSAIFSQSLTPIFALSQTFSSLLSGTGILNPREILETEEKKEEKREEETVQTV